MSVSLRFELLAIHAVTFSPSCPRSANIVAEKIFTPLNGTTAHRNTPSESSSIAIRVGWGCRGAASTGILAARYVGASKPHLDDGECQDGSRWFSRRWHELSPRGPGLGETRH